MGLTRQKKIIVGALALVLSLMVGYAILSESLSIKGTASTGSSDFNIIFSKINSISEKGSSNTTANIIDNGKKLEVKVPSLQYPTAYAEIDVTIKNEGELNAILTGIETQGLDNADIKVTYSGVAQDEVLGAGQEKRMKIKVLWDEASTKTSANATFTITITYEQDTEGKQTTTQPSIEQSDLFTWDGPTVVSGLTEKGIAYVKEHNGHLEIPEGVTEIADTNIIDTEAEDYLKKGFSPTAIAKTLKIEEELTEHTDEIYIIKSVSFPSTLKKIGDGAFPMQSYLTGELSFPSDLESIGDLSFAMTGINGELSIPNNVKTIGDDSFIATQITKLTLGEKVETIGKSAFSQCNQLSGELYIPDSVKTIGRSAFDATSQSNNKLTSISIGKNTTIDGNAFFNRPTPTVRD